MNYLFFDIECANCFDGRGKICSLGYVVTDEILNVINRAEIYINPNAPFDYYVRKNVLTCNPKDYELHKTFEKKYLEIKNLLTNNNTIVFGYGVLVDMEYIMSECLRYDLPFFSFNAIDVQRIYKECFNLETGLKLSKAIETLQINNQLAAHKSEDDAFATMLVLKEIINKTQSDINELIEKYPQALVKNDGKVITNKLWHQVLINFREEYINLVAEKTICIDEEYEKKNPREAIIIYDYLIKNGYSLDFYGENSNIFLEYKKGLEKRPKNKRFRINKIKEHTIIVDIEKFIEDNKITVNKCELELASKYRKYIKN